MMIIFNDYNLLRNFRTLCFDLEAGTQAERCSGRRALAVTGTETGASGVLTGIRQEAPSGSEMLRGAPGETHR